MGKIKIDSEKIFNEFWKDIVCNPDGSLNVEQVKKELADFNFIMDQIPKVYCHVTGDTLSKPMYYADSVIKCADDHLNDQIENANKELIKEISEEVESICIAYEISDFVRSVIKQSILKLKE